MPTLDLQSQSEFGSLFASLSFIFLSPHSTLQHAFPYRIKHSSDSTELVHVGPSRRDFIRKVHDQLHQHLSPLLANAGDSCPNELASQKSEIFDFSTEKGQKLHNLLDTFCHWIRYSLHDTKSFALADFEMLFPLVSVPLGLYEFFHSCFFANSAFHCSND